MSYDTQLNNQLQLLDPFIGQEEIIQYEQVNPFYIPMHGSDVKYVKTKFLAEQYNNVYILCLEEDFDNSKKNKNKISLFHQADSSMEELVAQANLVTLVKAPFSIIRINSIRSSVAVIEKQILEYFNHYCYELNNKELVYLMLETKENMVKSWLKMYDSESNLDKFIQQKILMSYYHLDDDTFDDNLIGLIGQVGDFKYWQDKNHCLLSINNAFSERKFNLSFSSRWKLPTEEIERELKNLLNNFSETKRNMKSANSANPAYPAEISDPNIGNDNKKNQNENQLDAFKMNTYVDGSKRDFNSFYPLTKPEELVINPETIEELLVGHTLNEKEKYYLICNLLASKNYCHYILTNKKILDSNKTIMNKYLPIFRYLMSYSWISLYMEESIRKTKITEKDRFVFDIETASSLPVFPFSPEHPYMNPYFCCMISDAMINPTQNIGGVKQCSEYQNGIVGLEEFRRRLNIFISGNENVNMLEGINWSNMVITGGCMAAIMPNTTPLMALFKKNPDTKVPLTEKELNRFFQEYYAKSDIDIACNHPNILDFIEDVKNLKETIQKNLSSIVTDPDVIVTPTKTVAVFINASILKEKCLNGQIPFKYEYIIANKNSKTIKFFFYELYLEQKRMANKNNKPILGDKVNDDEYFEIINYCGFEQMTLIINDISLENKFTDHCSPQFNSGLEIIHYIKDDNDKVVIGSKTAGTTLHPRERFRLSEDKVRLARSLASDETAMLLSEDKADITDEQNNEQNNEQLNQNIFINFSETLKYKISSPHLRHTLEVFRIKNDEFFSCISRFHLPCVRSYYNGKTCYLLPSAITAYHTLTNVEFKYFVGSRDPISIIDKYRKRGYSTILNKMEINQYLSYILVMGNYKKSYKISDSKDIKNIIGSLDVNHEYFKPRKNIPEDFPVETSIKLDYQNYLNPKLDYIKSVDDIVKIYKKIYPGFSKEFIEKRSIDASGQVVPLKRWLIDASYDMLN